MCCACTSAWRTLARTLQVWVDRSGRQCHVWRRRIKQRLCRACRQQHRLCHACAVNGAVHEPDALVGSCQAPADATTEAALCAVRSARYALCSTLDVVRPERYAMCRTRSTAAKLLVGTAH
eukprot:352277-Chlamydomonas_euryale.AAC.1